LHSHAVIDGYTTLGENNEIFPFASIGLKTQDLKWKGGITRTQIGSHNTFREYVTIHSATGDGEVTTVGSHNHILAYSHIAHNVTLGDHIIMSNVATLGGHIQVEDRAVIAGLAAVHQFCRVGKHAYIGGGTVVTQDVLPFSLTSATREAHAYGMNKIGLERKGFDRPRLRALHHAFRLLLSAKLNTGQAVEKLRAEGGESEDVRYLLEFVEGSKRGVIQ